MAIIIKRKLFWCVSIVHSHTPDEEEKGKKNPQNKLDIRAVQSGI